MSAKRTCHFPGCERAYNARGLCNAHYQRSRQLLKEGKVSEDDLVNRGIYLPSQKTGSDGAVTEFLLTGTVPEEA